MTINGGTFTATEVTPSHYASGGGTSTKGYALSVINNSGYSGAQVTVNGGTITGPVAILDDDSITNNNNSTLTINGNTYTVYSE